MDSQDFSNLFWLSIVSSLVALFILVLITMFTTKRGHK
jgi:hypothetical protein